MDDTNDTDQGDPVDKELVHSAHFVHLVRVVPSPCRNNRHA
jgi:hypothetical protein